LKVLVTGGTGFVGSHTVAALVSAGHAVRLLARVPERTPPALEPLGVEVGAVEVVQGDVTDAMAVGRALEGCEAAIHCASIYSLDARMDRAIKETNVRGTELVLEAAHRLGLDPIVHVSSYVGLIGTPDTTLTPESPPTRPPGAYLRTKADSDRVARAYQARGAPVVITYPGTVWGPHDPHCGESCLMMRSILRGDWSLTVQGGMPVTDVRDLARLHAAVLEAGRGPRRYMATAAGIATDEIVRRASALTGRKLSSTAVPAWTISWLVQVVGLAARITRRRIDMGDYQGLYAAKLFPRMDDSATRQEFGIEPRSLDDTMVDTITWMVQAGHLAPDLAGHLASSHRQPDPEPVVRRAV
jgi:dihydroflavonol-4-reductase